MRFQADAVRQECFPGLIPGTPNVHTTAPYRTASRGISALHCLTVGPAEADWQIGRCLSTAENDQLDERRRAGDERRMGPPTTLSGWKGEIEELINLHSGLGGRDLSARLGSRLCCCMRRSLV